MPIGLTPAHGTYLGEIRVNLPPILRFQALIPVCHMLAIVQIGKRSSTAKRSADSAITVLTVQFNHARMSCTMTMMSTSASSEHKFNILKICFEHSNLSECIKIELSVAVVGLYVYNFTVRVMAWKMINAYDELHQLHLPHNRSLLSY